MEGNATVSTARVACFLSKPIDIARLRAEVRRALEEREAKEPAAEAGRTPA
jgi:DNA-binding NtrC family response regulator